MRVGNKTQDVETRHRSRIDEADQVKRVVAAGDSRSTKPTIYICVRGKTDFTLGARAGRCIATTIIDGIAARAPRCVSPTTSVCPIAI